MSIEKQPTLPDRRGYFGEFGGQFVSETLMHALDELREAYGRWREDDEFVRRMDADLADLLDAEWCYSPPFNAPLDPLHGLAAAALNARESGIAQAPPFAGSPDRLVLDVRTAAEFAAETPYHYSTYEDESEVPPADRPRVVVLGSGPNRIGQGIEFDYCCVHAALALRDDGYETIMVNCNPETVSTDYDTSDRLYFEPLTLEDVLEIVHKENPDGVIVQFGGQTPLKLARPLEAAGVPIIGTSPDSIDLAEDRERFQQLLDRLGLRQPPNRTATSAEQAVKLAGEIGYPLVVRPSYVLGGRAMEIVYSEKDLLRYMREAVSVSDEAPVLLDRFMEEAIELDVDAGGAGSS